MSETVLVAIITIVGTAITAAITAAIAAWAAVRKASSDTEKHFAKSIPAVELQKQIKQLMKDKSALQKQLGKVQTTAADKGGN